MAEVFWNSKENKNWENFVKRVDINATRLRIMTHGDQKLVGTLISLRIDELQKMKSQ